MYPQSREGVKIRLYSDRRNVIIILSLCSVGMALGGDMQLTVSGDEIRRASS